MSSYNGEGRDIKRALSFISLCHARIYLFNPFQYEAGIKS